VWNYCRNCLHMRLVCMRYISQFPQRRKWHGRLWTLTGVMKPYKRLGLCLFCYYYRACHFVAITRETTDWRSYTVSDGKGGVKMQDVCGVSKESGERKSGLRVQAWKATILRECKNAKMGLKWKMLTYPCQTMCFGTQTAVLCQSESVYDTIRYDTIVEFNVDSKAEYTA